MIDSTLLIAVERSQVDLEVLRRRFAGEAFVVAAITASELQSSPRPPEVTQ